MPLAFLAPLFAAGAALVVVPWLIHQIRRPEREPMRFSSVMFIPKSDQRIIERRRIQHLLLMALRMATFVALAVAFSRPFLAGRLASDESRSPADHVIALDTSFSMGTEGRFEAALARANEIIDSIEASNASERVALLTFASSPRVLAALQAEDDVRVGTSEAARAALSSVSLTEEATNYASAIARAGELLARDADGESGKANPSGSPEAADDRRRIIHVISDFQSAGFSGGGAHRKLAPGIELHPVDVGGDSNGNLSVVDIAVREIAGDKLRIQAKIKNWSEDGSHAGRVRLIVGEKTVVENEFAVGPRNATQTSFEIPIGGRSRIEGRVEIGVDDLRIDDRRWFAWGSPRRRSVLLIADPQPEVRWPAAWFLTHAINPGADLPWETSTVEQKDFTARLAGEPVRPDVIMACDLKGLSEGVATALLDYASGGGSVLLALNSSFEADALNERLLDDLGLRSEGLLRAGASSRRYSLFSWLDLDHPIFAPFRGAQYNDFSQIRFYNYHRLGPTPGRAEGEGFAGMKVLARLEGLQSGEQFPAIIEVAYGQGNFIIWTFGFELSMTNLPKDVRSLPIVQQTLRHMTGAADERLHWVVGETLHGAVRPSPNEDLWSFAAPGETSRELTGAELARFLALPLSRSGIQSWGAAGEGAASSIAINVDSRESDPQRVAPDEFVHRFTSVQPDGESGVVADGSSRDTDAEGLAGGREFGRWFIGAIFALLLLECWYAPRLVR